MYRLFLIDDNKYECNGLINSIDWGRLDVEVVGAFANGADALAKIDELKPHIIVTDIAMPVMNGIEMAECIKEKYPNIKVIFISCHSDFEFAKSAVDLGIYGYVLKPIISDELEKAVEKLVAELKAQDMQLLEKEKMMKQIVEMLPLVQEQFFRELLLGNYPNEEDIKNRLDFLKIPVEDGEQIYVMSIKINDFDANVSEADVADSYLVSYSLKNIIYSFSNEGRRIFPVQISGGEFAAIYFRKGENAVKEDIINTAVEIINEINGRLRRSITIGISKCSKKLVEIPLLYKQSCKALNTRFYNNNPIILFEDIEDATEPSLEDIPNLESVYNDVKMLVSCGTDQDIRDFIRKHLEVEESRSDENYVKGFTILTVNIARIILMESNVSFIDIFGDDMLVWDKLSRFETIVDVKQWLYNIFRTIKEYLEERNSTKYNKTVETIKNIIKNRYHEQITIEDISKSVYLSGRHANSIFKKETGRTIFDFLLEYRIEIAKKLLREPDSKVSRVAEMVGYLNTSYFCLAFKKNVGMTPAEYKSKVNLK